jgi:hypothetical protein
MSEVGVRRIEPLGLDHEIVTEAADFLRLPLQRG